MSGSYSVFGVMGADHGGLAMAGHLGLVGFDVRLFNRTSAQPGARIDPRWRRGGRGGSIGIRPGSGGLRLSGRPACWSRRGDGRRPRDGASVHGRAVRPASEGRPDRRPKSRPNLRRPGARSSTERTGLHRPSSQQVIVRSHQLAICRLRPAGEGYPSSPRLRCVSRPTETRDSSSGVSKLTYSVHNEAIPPGKVAKNSPVSC